LSVIVSLAQFGDCLIAQNCNV